MPNKIFSTVKQTLGAVKLLAVLLVVSDHVYFPACYISIWHTVPIVQKSHFTHQEYYDASEMGYVHSGWCTLENHQIVTNKRSLESHVHAFITSSVV